MGKRSLQSEAIGQRYGGAVAPGRDLAYSRSASVSRAHQSLAAHQDESACVSCAYSRVDQGYGKGKGTVMSRKPPRRRAAPSSDPDELETTSHSDQDVDLGQVNRGVLWNRLALTQTQLAQMAGLSQRQISRWEAHGLLTPSSSVPGRYNGEDVERVILMQRAIARGYRPTRAAKLASIALTRQVDRDNFAPPSAIATRELLLQIEQSLATLHEMLFPDRAGP